MSSNQPSRSWSLDFVIGAAAALAIVVIVVYMRPAPHEEEVAAPKPLQPIARRPLKLSERLRPRKEARRPAHVAPPEERAGRIVAQSGAPVAANTPVARAPEAAVGDGFAANPRAPSDLGAPSNEPEEPEEPDIEDDAENIPKLTGVVIGDPDPERRLTAVELLAATEDPQVITVLARALADENEEVRMSALEALSDFTGEAPAVAIEGALRDPSPDIRYEAVSMLADVGTARARRAVEAALNDPDEQVRFLAQTVLDMNDPRENPQAPGGAPR